MANLWLVDEGTDNLFDFKDELENSSGAAEEMAGIMDDNAAGSLKILWSAVQEVGLAFSDIIEGPFRSFIDSVTEIVRWFGELDGSIQVAIVVNFISQQVAERLYPACVWHHTAVLFLWRLAAGKRHKDVSINSKYYQVLKSETNIEQIGMRKLRTTVDMVTAELPYGISIGSTKDIIDAGGIKFSTGLFVWQKWLQFDDSLYSYRINMVQGQT